MKPRPPSPLLIPSLVRKQIEARSYSPLKINFRLGSVQFAKNNPRNDRARSKAISRVHHHEFSFLDQNESSRDSIIFQPAFVTTFPLPELINSPLSSRSGGKDPATVESIVEKYSLSLKSSVFPSRFA